MQYVNDDMDELFRRAAKDYPLNTNSADWEKVKKKLMGASSGGEQKPSNGNNRRHFLWLLLLLPLPWICDRYTGDGGNDLAEAEQTEGKPGAFIQNSPANKNSTTKNIPVNVPTPTSEQGTVPAAASSGLSGNNREIAQINGPETIFAFRNTQKSRQAGLSPQAEEVLSPEKAAQESVDRTERLANRIKEEPAITPTTTALETSQSDTTSLAKKTAQVDSAAITPSDKKKQKSERSKHIYAGVLGGLDITSIEMQEVNEVGYDVGLVVGYAINKRWSVETGLLSSEKAYYTNGEYLPKAYLLPGTKLTEAQGDCRMWEVPLLVRYQFKEGKKGGWFAAAGASSYFMKDEDYTYTYYYLTTGQEVERSRSYESNSNHWFAAAQISGGYNRNLSKTVGVRVEPYIKLPLRKVGYYDLPLTSFGVHVGVTKKLW
jgi:hypothetical protein